MQKPLLLPTYFKWIGVTTLAMTIISIITLSVIFDVHLKNIIWSKLVVKILIATSFIFIVSAREKIEDEFILQCRMRAMAGSFILNFFCSIFSDITKNYCSSLYTPMFGTLFGVGCFQAMMYLSTFYSLKKGYAK